MTDEDDLQGEVAVEDDEDNDSSHASSRDHS